MIEIRHNLDEMNDALRKYPRLSGKTMDETLQKQGGKLGFAIRRNLKGLAPPKGQIRSQMLSRIAAGGGIRIRDSIRQQVLDQIAGRGTGGRGRKRNTQQEAVRRELNMRESARGFLGWSARYPRMLMKPDRAMSRYGGTLSELGLNFKGSKKFVRFTWAGTGRQGRQAAEGLKERASQSAIARAIQQTRDDILIYVRRKEQQLLTQSLRNVGRRARSLRMA